MNFSAFDVIMRMVYCICPSVGKDSEEMYINWKFCGKIKTISYPSSVLTLSIAVTIIVLVFDITKLSKLKTE